LSGTIFLIVGLGICGFIWLLSVQMRGLTVRALFLAGQDKFPNINVGDVQAAAKASAGDARMEGDVGQVQAWLQETYPQAVQHLRLARRGAMVGPVLMLVVVAVWRFGFGGTL